MRRFATSWRLLAVAVACSLVLVVLLGRSAQRHEHEQTLRELIASAQLISELAIEIRLLPGPPGHELPESAREGIEASVEHLKKEGQLVGLQLWDPDGHLLYSDAEEPDELSAEEWAQVPEVLAGEPQVELEHDQGRAAATATVLLRPENSTDAPSGLIAEVLLPREEVAAALAASTRRLYVAASVLLLAVAGTGLALRRRMLRREHEATHDPLTGLGNRALLQHAAATALRQHSATALRARRGGVLALLLLDLDGFKTVNDTLGHAVGDQLLQQVGSMIRGCVRSGDLVVRLGGDEFAVLLPDLPDKEAALAAAGHLSACLHRPFTVAGVTLEVGASVGVALAPGHGNDLDSLLRSADVAMYQAKRAGGGVAAYDEERDPHDSAQLDLLAQLRGAIEDGQLRLHYQPKVALRGGATVGFEALVRWQHPERGLLLPGAFLPLAERTALMRPLTDWVLGEAATRCAAWRSSGWDVAVAVNIPPQTLLQADFPARVVRLLAEAGLAGEALELEITETAVMVDPAGAGHTLRELQAIGVGVAIDDFGAGYTSLSYLKTLPVRSLKIDRGFITDLVHSPQDEAVARSVVGLGHDLGLTVVAEGVETAEVQQRLVELGCDEAQGYLLSRPLPEDGVHAWLAVHAQAQPWREPTRPHLPSDTSR